MEAGDKDLNANSNNQYKLDREGGAADNLAVGEESKVAAPSLTHEKLPHITGATIVSSSNNKKQVDSKSSASKLIPNSHTALMQNNLSAGVGTGNTENATTQDSR